MNTKSRWPGGFVRALVLVLGGMGLLPATASAFPSFGPNDYGSRPFACQTCHVATSGGSECAGLSPSRAPCLNAYGASYFASGYTNTTSQNADGDLWTNSVEINSTGASPLPGWPQGALEAGCNMETCAFAVSATLNDTWGSYVGCTQNVECRARHTAAQRYTFSFRCRLGTTGTVSNGVHDWGCTDPNECAGNPCAPGICNQFLTGDTWVAPGYACSGCPAGYALNSDSTLCVLQNECAANLDTCDPLATCNDPSTTVGNFTCTCPPGYSGNGRTGPGGTGCTNINECASSPCGANGVSCTQTPLGSGWTPPGYSCTCATNYGFNGVTCVLTNECTATPPLCVPGLSTCNDPSVVNGDVQCACIAGYSGNGFVSGTGCTNINECSSGANNCSSLATCMDAPGTFSCQCNPGATGNGVTCVDTNECAPQPCGVGGTCAQTPLGPLWSQPGYTCDCRAGYATNGTTCTLQDECLAALDDCVSGARCSDPNTGAGNFQCICPTGYTGDGRSSGTNCTNVNECETGEDNCAPEATCADNPGSFTCTCNEGYEGDGQSCFDVDECATGTNTCSPFAECTNSLGGFTCTCRDGFQGTGTNCIDVDECAIDAPCGEREVCVNQLGAAPVCECEAGYTRVEGLCSRACGDGVRGPGEGCDDANEAPGDGCDAGCLIESGWACFEPPGGPSQCTNRCGDGLIDYPAEQCDDGDGNSDTAPDGCRSVCQQAFCGDGVVDAEEACDEGENNSATLPNGCRPTCETAFCGDGIVDESEVCDPGVGVAIDPERCARLCFAETAPGLRSGGCSASAGLRAGLGRGNGWPLFLTLMLGLGLHWRRRRG